jgi:hypothetical protein
MYLKNILVVNGNKLNSYALSLEAAYYYSKLGDKVNYLDLNIYSNPFSKLRKLRNSILEKNKINLVYIAGCLTLTLKSAILASQWYLNASRNKNPWEYRLQTINLETGELVRSLIARTMGTGNFSLKECRKIQVFEIVLKLFVSYQRTKIAIAKADGLINLGIAHGGRDSFSAGAVAAFREKGVKVRLIESGGIPSNWSNFETSPHYSPDFWTRLSGVPESQLGTINDSIRNWWTIRIKGSDHFRGEEWSQTRTSGKIPLDLPKEFISFFTTSEFEIPVFKDFDVFPGEYKNQFEALEDLYRVASELNLHVVVRRHPNSIDWQGIDREEVIWENFKKLPNLTYIGPKEKVDSITLAVLSKQVFTFKSSVGIEAIWLGTSAYAMGPARWAWSEELRVWDKHKLKSILQFTPVVNQENAVRWAVMMMKMDNPNQIFESITGNIAKYQDRIYYIKNFDRKIEQIFLYTLFITQKFRAKASHLN